MTDDRSLERAARSWLEEGPTRAPEQPVQAALARIQTTRQERELVLPWRLPTMFTNRVAVAALALVLIVAGGGLALSRLTGGNVGGPGPAPTASPIPSINPTPTAPPPSAATLALTPSDVSKPLQGATYRVDAFAAPFHVALPAGWNATEFTPTSIGLAAVNNPGLNIYLAVVDKVYPDPCKTADGPIGVAPGVDALVTALSAMPGFDVTNLTDATVGGAAGKTFTVSNSIDVAADNCSGDTLPIGTHTGDSGDVDIAMFGGETDRFWVLDARGTTVFMAVTENKVLPTQGVRDSLSFESAATN